MRYYLFLILFCFFVDTQIIGTTTSSSSSGGPYTTPAQNCCGTALHTIYIV